MTALPSHVQELADRVATGHGVEVLELTLRGQGRRRVLSVVLDAEEPVEADVVELVTKDLSRELDQADRLYPTTLAAVRAFRRPSSQPSGSHGDE